MCGDKRKQGPCFVSLGKNMTFFSLDNPLHAFSSKNGIIPWKFDPNISFTIFNDFY